MEHIFVTHISLDLQAPRCGMEGGGGGGDGGHRGYGDAHLSSKFLLNFRLQVVVRGR